MSLLKLAPDSERLRRIARAYAAGEVEESEYRRIRTEVIDGFVPDPHLGDDTQQRWSPPEPSAESADASTDAAPVERAPPLVSELRSARIGAALFAVIVLIAVVWLL
jgi:hypothetical protein